MNHYNLFSIHEAFYQYGSVLEVDSVCLKGKDQLSLQVIVLVSSVEDLPSEFFVSTIYGYSKLVKLSVLMSWDLNSSLRDGTYVPTFGVVLPAQFPPLLLNSPLRFNQPRLDFSHM